MPLGDKREPSREFEDQLAQALLSKFLTGEIGTLEPTHDAQTGYHYPAAEAIAGSAQKAEVLLNRLVQEKSLIRKIFDKVNFCPHCGSSHISFRYTCPFCKSFDIQKSSLIEHVKCGYMDLEQNFRKDGKQVCPKCRTEITRIGVDHRKAGVWCACRECKKSFDIPVPQHYCLSCHSTSSFEAAIIKDIYSYSLDEAVKKRMSSDQFFVAPVRDLLAKQGHRVEAPAYLVGKSGAKHSFNLAAYKENKVIVIDLAVSNDGPVAEQPVISLFAKIFDIIPFKAFLVAIPSLNDNARKMTELYNIQAIDAKNQDEALAALKQVL